MLRCLLLTNLYPNPVEPERGIFVRQLEIALGEYVDLTIVSPLPYFPGWRILGRFRKWYRFSRVPKVLRNESGNGKEIYYPKYIVFPKIGASLHAVSMFLALYPLIHRLHRRIRFDVINAQWLYPDGVAGFLIGRCLGIPVVLTGHGCDVNRDLAVPGIGWQIANALRKADLVTVVSKAMAEALIAHGVVGKKICVIPNGVDPVLFPLQDRAVSRERLGLSAERRHILFVGQLVEVKAIHVLVQAVKILKARFSQPVTVHLVGEGPLEGRLRTLAAGEGVEDAISFEGQKRHAEVADWMAAADVLCLPSKREGCPNVVLEALAAGIPVVASAVGAIPELVDEQSGILVPPGDPGALADALATALQKKWNPLAIRDRLGGLSWKSVAKRYVDQFYRVAGPALTKSQAR